VFRTFHRVSSSPHHDSLDANKAEDLKEGRNNKIHGPSSITSGMIRLLKQKEALRDIYHILFQFAGFRKKT
jgi:hypothetical protein